MKIRYFLTLLIFFLCVDAWGWVVNDTFIIDGITYEVKDATARTVRARRLNNGCANADGKVVVPYEITDPLDSEKKFYVTSVNFHTAIHSSVKIVELSEGITELQANSFYSIAIDKLIIPASVTTATHIGSGTIKEIEVASSSTHFRIGTGLTGDDDDKDLYQYNADGTTLALKYHVKGNMAHVVDGVYMTPENVTVLDPSTFAAGENNFTKIHFHANVSSYENGSGYSFTGSKITDIKVDEENTTFSDIDGILYSKDGKTLKLFPLGRSADTYTVPDGVTIIGANALMGSNIKYLVLNDVENINLWGNGYIKTVTFGKNTQTISIKYNSGIEKFIVPEENAYFYAGEDGILFNKDKTKLVKCPDHMNFTEYTIPSIVTELADHAFYNVKPGTSASPITYKIYANANLKRIGTEAFRDSRLELIDFSACTELTSFAYGTFTGCTYLKEITIPAGITSIGQVLFQGCTNLTTVNIPAGNLQSIGTDAFRGLTKLETINIDPDCPLTTISARAFYKNTGLKSLALPKTVTNIESGAFTGCTNLATVTFAADAQIKKIGSSAFAFSGLKTITIPEGVTTIGAEAFEQCDVLEEVTLPSSVTSISGQAFEFCSKLKNVYVAEGNTKYSAINGILLNKDKTTLVLFPPAKANDKFTLLPPSITKLGDYAFYTCTNLKNVVIPNKVTSIGERTFGMCSNLNTITFLCDEMIPAANINQTVNKVAFDDDMFANIDINVRKNLLSTYQNDDFYKKFKSISPSFEQGTEEYIAVSDNAVDLLSTTSTNTTFVVPTSVEQSSKTYNVSMIGDYCLQNAPATMTEVVVGKNVSYIGAKAFINTSNSIKNIFFLPATASKDVLSTNQFELTSAYNEFAADQNIYVKKSVADTYKTEWVNYASKITYQIPFPAISTSFGTFSREFDVDLSDNNWNSTYNKPSVIAFTGKVEDFTYIDEETHEEVTGILMSSINCGQGTDLDGIYIPANTGVLLRAYTDDAKSPSGFYYRIGEKTVATPASNIMQCVTETSRSVSPTETVSGTNYTNYVISGGEYHTLTSAITIPAHKSYMHIPTSSGAKGIKLMFEDDNNPTDIITIHTTPSTNQDIIYDLQGRRITSPSKGLYILNGKKVRY